MKRGVLIVACVAGLVTTLPLLLLVVLLVTAAAVRAEQAAACSGQGSGAGLQAPFLPLGTSPQAGQRYSVVTTRYGPPGVDPGTGSSGYDAAGRAVDLVAYRWDWAELAGPGGIGTAMSGLPRGTRIMVTNPANGQSVIVAKWDVGFGGSPFQGHPRIIDLWYAAADAIGVTGTSVVVIQRLPGLAASPAAGATPSPAGVVGRLPDACLAAFGTDGSAGSRAVQAALAYLGTPYVWGGGGTNGPSTGTCVGYSGPAPCMADHTVGFDCSGLVQYAWGRVGVALPRVTYAQWNAGRHLAPSFADRAALRAGDLIFFNFDGALGHVAIWIGPDQIIEAPHTGASVRIVNLDSSPAYQQAWAGAVRPTYPPIRA